MEHRASVDVCSDQVYPAQKSMRKFSSRHVGLTQASNTETKYVHCWHELGVVYPTDYERRCVITLVQGHVEDDGGDRAVSRSTVQTAG